MEIFSRLLNFNLTIVIYCAQGGQSLESLEDFKRKLDNEHTTVSAKLDQGARARQELQELKSKLVEDLEVSFEFRFIVGPSTESF